MLVSTTTCRVTITPREKFGVSSREDDTSVVVVVLEPNVDSMPSSSSLGVPRVVSLSCTDFVSSRSSSESNQFLTGCLRVDLLQN